MSPSDQPLLGPIFAYSDYRIFLSDYYAFKKATEKGFSHRVFLSRCGMKGPNYLKNIIDRKVNLSKPGIEKFIAAMGLLGKEADYFRSLVLYNQAVKWDDKQLEFEKLSAFADISPVFKLQKEKFAYLTNWHAVAIREFIHANKWNGDYVELAQAIYPKITPRQAQEAVEQLLALGIIRKTDSNHFELTHLQVSTGASTDSLVAVRYHESMSQLAAQAITKFTRPERYFRGITASMSKESYDTLRLEIDQFAKRIHEIIESDRGTRRVYQINLQAFPLFPPAPMRKRRKKNG